MFLDFTLDKYQVLCHTLLDCGYSPLTVYEYLIRREGQGSLPNQYAIFRHDVDRKPRNALKMANLEHSMGIKSTYYFRYPHTFKQEIISPIRDLGHEIGYHYEVVAKTKGDIKKAIYLFEEEITAFRKIYDVRTICMHGSPLSPYDNRDLWKDYDFQIYGVKGEAYLSISSPLPKGVGKFIAAPSGCLNESLHEKASDQLYFTDTGRSWSGKHSVRDKMENSNIIITVDTTNDLISRIKQNRKENLYLTVHPERWNNTYTGWVSSFVYDFLINNGKMVLLLIRRRHQSN